MKQPKFSHGHLTFFVTTIKACYCIYDTFCKLEVSDSGYVLATPSDKCCSQSNSWIGFCCLILIVQPSDCKAKRKWLRRERKQRNEGALEEGSCVGGLKRRVDFWSTDSGLFSCNMHVGRRAQLLSVAALNPWGIMDGAMNMSLNNNLHDSDNL